MKFLVLPKYYISLNVKVKVNHFNHHNCFGKMMVNSSIAIFKYLSFVHVHHVAYGCKASYCHDFLYFHVTVVLNLSLRSISPILPSSHLASGLAGWGGFALVDTPPVLVMHFECSCAFPLIPSSQILTSGCWVLYLQFSQFNPLTLIPAPSDQMPPILR